MNEPGLFRHLVKKVEIDIGSQALIMQ